MKQISLKFWIKAAFFTGIAILVAGLWVWNEHTYYSESIDEYQNLQHQTQEYLALKQRWAYDPTSEKVVELKTHPKLIRQEKVRGGYVFEFASLSAAEFNALSNTILNAPFAIKKLQMRRNPNGRGEITVEFEG